MAIADTNKIVRDYLVTSATATDPLIALVSTRIYSPRLAKNHTLPAICFSSRGGITNPHIPGIVEPSYQFRCYDDKPEDARNVYRKLYDALQGIQNIEVGSYDIMSAIEEVQGQDREDDEIPGYFYVLTFFRIMIRAE